MIRLTSPRAIVGCLAAVAVVAASATAKTTTANANRASDLQHDLEALVAAGALAALGIQRKRRPQEEEALEPVFDAA